MEWMAEDGRGIFIIASGLINDGMRGGNKRSKIQEIYQRWKRIADQMDGHGEVVIASSLKNDGMIGWTLAKQTPES